MKKLVLTFALLLTVSFAFATNEVENTPKFEIEEKISPELIKTNFTLETVSNIILIKSSENNVKWITYEFWCSNGSSGSFSCECDLAAAWRIANTLCRMF